MSDCPHADVKHCPLYHASHEGIGIGCDDGKLEDGACAVARGMDYHQEIAKLNPKYVSLCRWREEAEQSERQRKSNMRAAGVH